MFHNSAEKKYAEENVLVAIAVNKVATIIVRDESTVPRLFSFLKK